MAQTLDFITRTNRNLVITLEEDGSVSCNCGGFLLYGDCDHAQQVRQERGLPEQLPRAPKKFQKEILQAANPELSPSQTRQKKYKRVTDQLISK